MAPLISSLFSALSGIRASVRRQETSAHNLANVQSPGYQARRVTQTERSTGGTSVSSISPAPGFGPEAGLFVTEGETELLAGSNVDIAEELTGQILSLRSLQANVLVIRQSDEMTEEAVNLIERGDS